MDVYDADRDEETVWIVARGFCRYRVKVRRHCFFIGTVRVASLL
jgi:hypothetical protein